MPGGWTYSVEITPQELFIFYNALGKPTNYNYKPLAVARQIVNGVNYKFNCIAEPLAGNGIPFFAIVEIYSPIGKPPYVTNVCSAECPS